MAKGKSEGEGKKKSKKRGSGQSGGMVSLVGPAAAALLGPRLLLMVQKPEVGKEADDKTPFLIGGGAYWLSKQPKYKMYAPAAFVLAVMAYRRKLTLSGEMSEDPKDYIIGEGVVEVE